MSDVPAVGPGGAGARGPPPATTKKAEKATKDFKATLQKVDGHRYSRIASGDHKGHYVNQSGNERDGEVFRLVKRDGFEFHVYGDRVVRLPSKAQPS